MMALEYLREYRTYFHLGKSTILAKVPVIGCLKRFKILSDRYRNRRKRFGLRFNLIAGIYNADLAVR